MTTPTFTEGQRVYHRGRQEFGNYVMPGSDSDSSIVDFGYGDVSEITTAQLVPADEVEEGA